MSLSTVKLLHAASRRRRSMDERQLRPLDRESSTLPGRAMAPGPVHGVLRAARVSCAHCEHVCGHTDLVPSPSACGIRWCPPRRHRHNALRDRCCAYSAHCTTQLRLMGWSMGYAGQPPYSLRPACSRWAALTLGRAALYLSGARWAVHRRMNDSSDRWTASPARCRPKL